MNKIREALHLTLRGYKLWWERHPKMLVSNTAHAAAEALSPYVGIYLIAQIINEIAGARGTDRLIFLTALTLASTAALSLLTAVLLRWKNYHNSGIFSKWEKVGVDKLLAMDFRDVDSARTHDLISQMRQNTNFGGMGLAKLVWSFDTLVRSVLSIIGAFALTFSLFTSQVPESGGWLTVLNNPVFILLIIAVMFAVSLVSSMFSIKSRALVWGMMENMKFGNRVFLYVMTLARDRARALDVRMYRQDVSVKGLFDDTLRSPGAYSLATLSRKISKPMGLYNGASAVISHIFTAIIYIFVCLKAWGGAFGVGSITQYIRAISAMAEGVSSLLQYLGEMYNNVPFLKTSFSLLDTPNKMYQGTLSTEKRSDNKYAVEFRNVSFKYPNQETYALQNVSVTFNIGRRLAVVGENGSGKTTFIKLLCRLYDPTEGEILLNGIDIRKYDYKQYMDIFSVVFQDFQLLSLSLGQNVAASAKYNAEKAAESLAKSGFSEEWSLETQLYKDFEETGKEISGGEAQKIAIARALYKDAPFIILDEPTAALDPIAEAEIYGKMNEMVGEKTAVFISHRLSSCRFCDDIAVFHGGRLVQKGGHDVLVGDEEGKYRELWEAQAGYYQVG